MNGGGGGVMVTVCSPISRGERIGELRRGPRRRADNTKSHTHLPKGPAVHAPPWLHGGCASLMGGSPLKLPCQ